MATLLLSTAAQAIGGAIGGPIGAMAGRVAGAIAGGTIDSALTSRRGATKVTEGPRLADLDVQASQEGAPIPKAFGRVRLAGQIIWATRLEEDVTVEREGGSGGGKGSRGRAPASETRTYSYFANMAVGLCEGPITRIARAWADGKPLDLTTVSWRLHRGTDNQLPDAFLEARQGGPVPAYRGTAYVVFERLALEAFGNRIPQLTFEIVRAIGTLEPKVTAVTIIPGSSEFAYDPEIVRAQTAPGATVYENRHNTVAETDWTASIDELQDLCPNLKHAALVTAWFGTDLRAAECRPRPGVEWDAKTTIEDTWVVDGVARADAHVVSRIDGRPAYGGTPSDGSVVRAIADLNARGLKVTFYPFLLMDIEAGNGLPDPYGRSEQPPYPWRGRIACHPVAGQAGSPDGTPVAEAEIDAFFGSATAHQFSVGDGEVSYTGPDEWSWRRMVLHYAHLAKLAGGVDAFLVGSELRGLTWVRGAGGTYPAVRHLTEIAREVRTILGPDTRISYAADWSEYFGHHPADGGGDVTFHLDPFWSDAACDFVGIDNYMPLTDWRGGEGHADIAAGSPYAAEYIGQNIAGGEGYDWYYASEADRAAQARSPITDGAYGKPWVYRYKDLVAWWSQPHVDRVGGVETSATAWVPGSKPIWMTEVGIPAVDKGGNQPNVFFDPKSSESFLPYSSSGARDDFAQRRGIEALLDYWQGADDARNPAGMLDADAIHLWTWDARPFPVYPLAEDVWGDGPNWARGHWLSGRLGQAPAGELIAAILRGFGVEDFDVSAVDGTIDGYVVDRPMTPRDAIEPLMLALDIEAYERQGRLVFRSQRHLPAQTVEAERCVDDGKTPLVQVTRAQEAEIAATVALTFSDLLRDHGRSSVGAMRGATRSSHEAHADLPIVSQGEIIQPLAESWLHDLWVGRDAFALGLPPSRMALEPGDLLALDRDGAGAMLKIEDLRRSSALRVEARRYDRAVAETSMTDIRQPLAAASRPRQVVAEAAPHARLLQLPKLSADDADTVVHACALQSPWPGTIGVWREGGVSVVQVARITAPATMGTSLTDLAGGSVAIWDEASVVDVELHGGSLQALPDASILDGGNAVAIGTSELGWEIVQFGRAELIGPQTYRLSRLLRGRRGTDADVLALRPAGADIVLLDTALVPIDVGLDRLGRATTFRTGRSADPAASAAETIVPSARALRPLAPCHLLAIKIAGGIQLSWTRRSRVGGDSWYVASTPLGEAEERYRVEIVHAGGARVVETTVPDLVYAAPDIIADHGSVPRSFNVRVSQLSAIVGPGAVLDASVDITGVQA